MFACVDNYLNDKVNYVFIALGLAMIFSFISLVVSIVTFLRTGNINDLADSIMNQNCDDNYIKEPNHRDFYSLETHTNKKKSNR